MGDYKGFWSRIFLQIVFFSLFQNSIVELIGVNKLAENNKNYYYSEISVKWVIHTCQF